jgi:hypothetical protein
MPSSTKAADLKADIYVIVQTGGKVEIDVPEDFIPKAW